MKKLKSLVIMTSCVLLTGAIFPGNLTAETVTEEWVARYNGPANSGDIAQAIAVDTAGNVYVTGASDGIGTWNDYATVKYAPDGTQLWVARHDGPGNYNDYAQAIAVDASGNVYVTGGSYGSGTWGDYATIKYDTNGNELWVARYNGPGNYSDSAYAIAIDGSGNVYVTGRSNSGGVYAYDNYATIKYDTNGNELWVARYNGPGNSYDYAYAIAVDSSGNVYVTGGSDGIGTQMDYATVKYDTNGNELWVARHDGPANYSDLAHAIALDTAGNVYVTGRSYGIGTWNDYATVKYAPDGTQLWVARYNGPGNSGDGAEAIAVDTAGNVYVTGPSAGGGTNSDYATIKYAPDGTQLWVARYNGPANGSDFAHAIALDTAGNVYVTGHSVGSGTDQDYATIKYDSDGDEKWVAKYDGPANDIDGAYTIALDSTGNVYVTGHSVGSGTGYDYVTIKYSQPGTLLLGLLRDVINLNIEHGVINGLDAKLGAALGALDDLNENNDVAAINTLEAFIHVVEIQSGDVIPVEDADALIAAAQEIIDILSGT